MSDLIAADGTVLADELINTLADEAEAGFPNSTLTRQTAPWRETDTTDHD